MDPFSVARRNPDRVTALGEPLQALTEELEARKAGPGERVPYRLLSGSHGLPDGRTVRAGGELLLNGWEAARLGSRVERVEEAA